MLLCDTCDRGWHTTCLQPALAEVPAGTWHCAGCSDPNHTGTSAHPTRPTITISGEQLPWVDSAKYLGSWFDKSGSLDRELSHRIQLSAAAFHRLQQPFFQQRCIRLGTRMQVLNCMIISVLLYGSESWALSQTQLRRLATFHHHCLRQILGARRQDLSIEELLRRCGTLGIQEQIARRKLRWLGHLGRMDDSRLAKQLLTCTMGGTGRKRRRGAKSAISQLNEGYSQLTSEFLPPAVLRAAGYRNWLGLCQCRKTWRTVLDKIFLAPSQGLVHA